MSNTFLRFGKIFVIILLNMLPIPLAYPKGSSFFNAHNSQVWSFDGVTEFLHIPFTALELFD
jgi:hypothetical protein